MKGRMGRSINGRLQPLGRGVHYTEGSIVYREDYTIRRAVRYTERSMITTSHGEENNPQSAENYRHESYMYSCRYKFNNPPIKHDTYCIFGIFGCFRESVRSEPMKAVASGSASALTSLSSRFETSLLNL